MRSKVFVPLFIVFFAVSCIEKETETYIDPLLESSACGNEDPLNELKWLNAKIVSEKNPESGDFVESVWVRKFKSDDIIVIDFAGNQTDFYTFDCFGNHTVIDDPGFFDSLREDNVIYRSTKNNKNFR